MNLTAYSSAQAFLDQTRAVLERQEAANCLMLGTAQRLANESDNLAPGTLLATLDSYGEPILAVCMTPPYKLQLQGLGETPGDATRLLAQTLFEQGWALPGVMAQPILANRFAEHWCALSGQSHTLLVEERIYELREVRHPRYSPGECRVAEKADIDLVTAWILSFLEEATPDDPRDEAGARELARTKIAAGDAFLWQNGETVSMAHKTRPTAHGMCVNAVYTPPAFRGRGYATSCVARLSQAILDSGKSFCCLFTNLANSTSNHIYQSIGYKPICDVNVCAFNKK